VPPCVAAALLTLEAAAALRELIEQVVLTPDAEAADRLRAELHGDLAVLLAFSAAEAPPRRQAVRSGRETPETFVRGGLLTLVAGTRSRRSHHSTVRIWR
jgi:hypothetical protein